MTEQPLTLNHRDLVTKNLNTIGLHLSEFSFPNLYLFRETHKYSLITTENGLFISGMTYDKSPYLMPIVPPALSSKECFAELKDLLKTGKWKFVFPIPEEWNACFPQEEFQRSYNENDSDYLFCTEKMQNYPGKKMHKKRNLLKQFLKLYESLVVPLTSEVEQDARRILDLWQSSSPQELETSDYYQAQEALRLHQELGLTGVMYYAEGEPMGFILAEPLGEDTYTIHFAKADIRFKGAYQFMFSSFAQEYCSPYRYLNLEQDMGKEGLRKTKISYRPDLMAKKYRVELRS